MNGRRGPRSGICPGERAYPSVSVSDTYGTSRTPVSSPDMGSETSTAAPYRTCGYGCGESVHNLWITHGRGDAHVTGGVTPTSPLFVRGRGDAHVTQTVIPKPQVEPLGDPQVANPRTGAKYQAWRKAVLATCEPICIRCGYPVDMTLPPRHDDGPSADHEPPLAETGDLTPSLDGAGIAHLRCNRSHGGRLGAARRAANTTSSRAPRNPPRAKMLDKQDKPNRILENHQSTSLMAHAT